MSSVGCATLYGACFELCYDMTDKYNTFGGYLTMLRPTSYLLMTAIASLSLACGMAGSSAKPYTSQKHGFTITFPGGAKEPTLQAPRYASDMAAVYTTTNDNGVYRVKIVDWNESADGKPKSVKDVLIGAGIDAGDFPSDSESKETTFKGKAAIEESGWKWSEKPGADGQLVKLQRRVIGFRADDKRVFLIDMTTDKKEKLTTKEANDFFDSFKLDKAGN